ncbi:MAG: hypothetical protein JXA46_02625 [Dehalococcoidales bacterium]|nr:hypothetical protein [Dehalococcoidales bacterium]
MIKKSYIVNFIEWALVILMSLCCVLGFSHSIAGAGLQGWIADKYPEIGLMLFWIIWLLLFIAGILLAIFAGRNGAFGWLAAVFILPSLLAFDSINILKVVHLDFGITTTLTFVQALIIGITVMTCHILLNLLNILKKERHVYEERGAGMKDIERAFSGNHIWLWALVTFSILIVSSIILLSAGLSTVLLGPVSGLPWNFVLPGIICILVLAIFLYWLGLRHNSGQGQ